MNTLSASGAEECQVMTRKHHERRAGVRFSHLIRQLVDDGWSTQQIADAIGCDATLITKWRFRPGSTLPHDVARKGIGDLVIQGIHDGLRVRSDYLFMSPKGQPDKVKLKDGTERPCEPGELDHKPFVVRHIDEARTKRDVADLQKRVDAQESRADRTEARLDRMTLALEKVAAALGVDLGDDKRHTR
jgi:hypothetical protein